jgi:hypothetical protein
MAYGKGFEKFGALVFPNAPKMLHQTTKNDSKDIPFRGLFSLNMED